MNYLRSSIQWALGGLLVATTWSQTPPPPPGVSAVTAPAAGMRPLGQDFRFAQTSTFEFLAGEPAFLGTPVTGAPYSADAVTTTTRVLADGTKIENKSTSKLFRDSEGRTRREQTFSIVGTLVADAPEPPVQVTITDPVAKKTILLDPKTKTARALAAPPLPPMPPQPPAPGEIREDTVDVAIGSPVAPSGISAVVMRRPATQGPPHPARTIMNHTVVGHRVIQDDNVQAEDLGVRQIEGVAATGTRRTITIPTGAIGNDRPIVSTTEEWFSQELGMTVRRITKDPQVGEITYQVENLNRNEPPRDLFEIPADYTVIEAPNVMFRRAAPQE
jgi:hypothetical protein